MERYDNIEYDFENEKSVQDSAVQTTDKDGFITSQHYSQESVGINEPNAKNEEAAAEKSLKKKKANDMPKEYVIILQLVVCILIAAAAFVIKSMGGEFYETVRELYYDNLNNSLIINFETDSNDQAIKEILE